MLLIVVDLSNDVEVFVLNALEVVLLRKRFLNVLKLANEAILYFADVEDEVLLLVTPFLESGSNPIKLNCIAFHMHIVFALFTRNITTM